MCRICIVEEIMLKNKVARYIVIGVLVAWAAFLVFFSENFGLFIQELLMFSGNMIFGLLLVLLAAKNHDWWLLILSFLWLMIPEDILGVWNTPVSIAFFKLASAIFPLVISSVLFFDHKK